MAGQTSKNPLLAKLGNRLTQALDANRGKAPEVGNARLPGGIEGGIAKLTECKFGVYKDGPNKDQLFFYAAGTVVEPRTHKNQTVYGMTTKIGPEPLCDTPTSAGKRKKFSTGDPATGHWDWVANHLRILGFNPDAVPRDVTPEQADAMIVAGMEALKRPDPNDGTKATFFRFRTSLLPAQNIAQRSDGAWVLEQDGKIVEGKSWATKEMAQKANPYAGTPEAPKTPNVYEEWNGRCDYSHEVDPAGGTDDGTAFPPATTLTNGQHSTVGSSTGRSQSAVPNQPAQPRTMQHLPVQPKQPVPQPEPVQQFDETGGGLELNDLVRRASNLEDPTCAEAQESLLAMALERGIDDTTARNTDTWEQLVEMMQAASAGAGNSGMSVEDVQNATAPDDPAVWTPQKEEMYLFHPPEHWNKKFKPPQLKMGTNKKPLPPVEVEVLAVDAKTQKADLRDIASKVTYAGVSWDDFRPSEA